MLTAIKEAFASISASVSATPSVRVSRAVSTTLRRPSRRTRERRLSVISRENCKNKKNHKNESQKKLESIVFSSALMFEIEKTSELVFGDKDVRGSRTAANFNAFMEPADGSLSSYIKTRTLTKEQILDIGQQILEQLRCLYKLTPTKTVPPIPRYLYTDLKSGNVLYFDCGTEENKQRLKVQLGDLGSAVSTPKDGLNEFISTYPAFEHRDGGGFYPIDLTDLDVCSQVTSYQLGMLLFSLIKDTTDKGFLFSDETPDRESRQVKELNSKLDSLLPGLSNLVHYTPGKRPYMFSDDSLKTLIETHNPEEDLYSSSSTVVGSKKRGSVKKKKKKGKSSRKKRKQ